MSASSWARAVSVGVVALLIAAVPAAHAAPLRLDAGFGEGGVARVRFKLRYSAVDLRPLRPARQPDGKVLVGASGYFDHGNAQILIARFTRRGRPDPTFGHRGWAHLGLRWNFDPQAVHVQRDGRILVLGAAGYGPFFYPSPGQLGLARLLPDGSRDRSFGTNGFVTWNPPWRADTLSMYTLPGVFVPQADGRVLTAGVAEETRGASKGQPPQTSVRRVVFVRFSENGSVDESFGHVGVLEHPDDSVYFQTWARLTDGHLVALAQLGDSTTWLLRRFTADGALDRGFGQDGSPRVELNQALDFYSTQLVPASDRSLVLIGNDRLNSRAVPIRRILPDGTLDPSFGTACGRAPPAHLLGGAATSDGGILATATVSTRPARASTVVLRYASDGCAAGRPLRLGAATAAPPLLRGRHAALVGGATYNHELTLTRIRR
jgi:uncharacterized delta-60 repeat protein